MEQKIEELVQILKETEGVTFISCDVNGAQVRFSFLFESYQVFDLMKEKMPKEWHLHILGDGNICCLSYALAYLERYFTFQCKVAEAFYFDEFLELQKNMNLY